MEIECENHLCFFTDYWEEAIFFCSAHREFEAAKKFKSELRVDRRSEEGPAPRRRSAPVSILERSDRIMEPPTTLAGFQKDRTSRKNLKRRRAKDSRSDHPVAKRPRKSPNLQSERCGRDKTPHKNRKRRRPQESSRSEHPQAKRPRLSHDLEKGTRGRDKEPLKNLKRRRPQKSSGSEHPQAKRLRLSHDLEAGTRGRDKKPIKNLKRRRPQELCGSEHPQAKRPRPSLSLEAGEHEPKPSGSGDGAAAPLRLEDLMFHKILGSGGYGKVVLASHPSSRKQLAVKMIQKRLLLEDDRDSIFIERQVLEMTSRSHLFTHCFAALQNQDYIFYVMECVTGGELRHFIHRRAPCSIQTSRFISAEIVSGLIYLHLRGIMHRDLKPENILMDATGHIKIADFGLAVMNIYGSGTITEDAGTPGYMAPEVFLQKPYNNSVDYFAFGVILYEMATGSFPFYEDENPLNSNSNSMQILQSIQNFECPKNLDYDIQDILKGVFLESPENRQDFCRTILSHPFFTEINWLDIFNGRARPPYVMEPTEAVTSYYSVPLPVLMSSEEARKPPITSEDREVFKGFSYKSPTWR